MAHPQGGDDWSSDLFEPGIYLAYLGVVAAFVLPTMGALSAASISL